MKDINLLTKNFMMMARIESKDRTRVDYHTFKDFLVIGLPDDGSRELIGAIQCQDNIVLEFMLSSLLLLYKENFKLNDVQFTKICHKIMKDALHIEHHKIDKKFKDLMDEN